MKHFFAAALALLVNVCLAQVNTWVNKAPFPGDDRYIGTSFTIGTKIYYGTGLDNSTAMFKDFWEYNTTTNTWTQKKDFEGTARMGAVGFSLNGKGYVALGFDFGSGNAFKDVWEYDPATDDWTQKSNAPFSARSGATAFVIGTKAYVGTGDDPSISNKDFYEYTASTDTWVKKADLPGVGRSYAAAFSIGSLGYVGGGLNADSDPINDFYEYNPATNVWTTKANIPEGKGGAIAFASSTRGFVGMGNTAQMYSYYPTQNVWLQQTGFTNPYANGSVGYVAGVAYVGIGLGFGEAAFPAFFAYTVATEQTITFNALTDKTFGDANFNLSATITSGSPITYESSNTSVATISGTTVTITGAGTTTITAKAFATGVFDAAVPVQRTLTVNKAAQTITFNALAAKKVNDPSFGLTATSSSGLPVSYSSSNTAVATISGSTVTIVGAGSTMITPSNGGNANYLPVTGTARELVVTKVDQTITFNALADKTTTDAPFLLTATASSGLAVSYTSSNTSVATINGLQVTIVGAGTTTITASQSGNTTFNAAANVDRSLNVSFVKLAQTIDFPEPAVLKFPGTNFFTLVFPKASSGLPVTLTSVPANGILDIRGNVVWVFGAFNGTIKASQAGNDKYLPAVDMSVNFVVQKSDVPITMEPFLEKSTADAPFTPKVISPGAALVTLTSSVPGVATIVNGQVKINGKGTSVIKATRTGNDFITASAEQTLTVKDPQTITFANIPEKTLGDAAFNVTATSSSGLPVTFTSSDENIATVSGNTVTIKGVGNAQISATAGNASFTTTTESRVLHVKNVVQTIEQQGQIFGVHSYAGLQAGVIYRMDADGKGFAVTKTFTQGSSGGSKPVGAMVKGDNGMFYGATSTGGVNNGGSLYEFNPSTGSVTKVYDFLINDNPIFNQVPISNGKLYGAKLQDGSGLNPLVFEFDINTKTMTKTLIVSQLLNYVTDISMSKAGKLYITGASADRTKRLFFEWDLSSNTLVPKGSLNLAAGIFNNLNWAEYTTGSFFGTTSEGGTNNQGYVLRFDPSTSTSVQTTSFEASPTSQTNAQGLILASNGMMYGATYYGGANMYGYVYEYNPNTSLLNTLALFNASAGTPSGKLMEGSNGKLYGSGSSGGQRDQFFEFDPKTNNLVTVGLVNTSQGGGFRGSPVMNGNKIYAASYNGGADHAGSLVEFDYTTRALKEVYKFGGTAEGYFPQFGLTPANNGKLYGINKFGGANDVGTLFEYDPTTDGVTTKVTFDLSTIGGYPIAGLLAGINGKLYGATTSGGKVSGGGVVFEFDPQSGTLNVISYLQSDVAANIDGEMVQAPSGKIYAVSSTGGGDYNGTLVEIDPVAKTVTRLAKFSDTNGKNPDTGLLLASNGKLYGTTLSGGTNNLGTLYEFDIATSTLTPKFNFANNSSTPSGGLVEYNGKLIGMTTYGGASNIGTIYEYDFANGSYKKRYDFQQDAYMPSGKLMLTASGKLWGTTMLGANFNGAGIVFEYDPTAGSITQKQVLLRPWVTMNYSCLSQIVKSTKRDQVITIDPIGPKVVGEQFVATASSTSGLAVQMSGGSPNIFVSELSGTVTLSSPGKAIIKANQAGNSSFFPAQEVQTTFCVDPAKPVITMTNSNMAMVTLTSSNTSGNQWYKDGVAIDASTSIQVKAPGVYMVQSTVDGCVGEMSADAPVIVTGDGDTNNVLTLYPNPVSDRLYIMLPGGNMKRVRLVYNDGRALIEYNTSSEMLEVDVRGYSSGLYLVRISDENGEKAPLKFIKK